MFNVASLKKCFLVKLKISQFNNSRLDVRLANEVVESHDSVLAGDKFKKTILLPHYFAGVNKAANQVRAYFNYHTAPWLDDGVRVLPVQAYMDFCAGFRPVREAFEREVSSIINRYDEIVNESREVRKSMFEQELVPTVEELKAKYDIELKVLPFPTDSDLRIEEGIDSQTLQEIRESVRKEIEEGSGNVLSYLAKQVRESIEKLYKVCSIQDHGEFCKSFRASQLTAVGEALDAYKSFTGQQDFMATMGQALSNTSADILRHSFNARQSVKQTLIPIVRSFDNVEQSDNG